MAEGNGRIRPSIQQSRVITQCLRKRSSNGEELRNRSKRRRLVSEAEILTTLIPDSSPSMRSHNLFNSVRSSPLKHGRKHKRSKVIDKEACRKWVCSSRDLSGCEDKVVVVSYNILGVENASKHPDLYHNVLPKYLEWGWRRKLIREEISHYNASILCFQEVDRYIDLDNLFQKDGFKGVYKARTGETCDGCAIFWKDRMFSLLHEESIEFQSFGLRNNVAQLCVFKLKQDPSNSNVDLETSMDLCQSRSLVVGNMHVLFNPNRGDIKLGQVRMFLERAYKLSQEWGSIPVIISGDLNSVPQSAIYQFLASSELNIRQYDRRKISGQVERSPPPIAFRSQNGNAASVWMPISRPLTYSWSGEELKLATGSEAASHLRHQLKLTSAYLGVPGSHSTRDNYGEPLATSYHSKFAGTVDYIWHTEELVPVRVLETLPINTLRRTRGLPSEKWGSDHLALVCELAFVDGGNRT